MSTGLPKTKETLAGIGKDIEKLELSYMACGHVEWCGWFGTQFCSSSENLPYDKAQQFHSGILQEVNGK